MVSIMIPAYKEKHLGECIESVLGQTYGDIEVVVVDDASTENLKEIVDRYDDPRIRYFRNDKGFGAEHVVGNWNRCLSLARGEYGLCMGDDDMLLPECIEEFVKLVKDFPNLDVYHGQAAVIDDNGKVIGMETPRPMKESVYSLMYNRWFEGRSQYLGDWLFRLKPLKENGGFTELPYGWEADDCTAFAACGKKGVANTQVPVFLYRKSSATISSDSSNVDKKLEAHRMAMGICMKLLENEPDNEWDRFYRQELIRRADEHLNISSGYDIGEDIMKVPSRVLHWMAHRRRYGVTRRTLAWATAFAIYQRFKKKEQNTDG